MLRLIGRRHWVRDLAFVLTVSIGRVEANPDLGATDSAGVLLAVLGLVVLLLGLHHLRDLRHKTLMPPGYRGRHLRRGARPSAPDKD